MCANGNERKIENKRAIERTKLERMWEPNEMKFCMENVRNEHPVNSELFWAERKRESARLCVNIPKRVRVWSHPTRLCKMLVWRQLYAVHHTADSVSLIIFGVRITRFSFRWSLFCVFFYVYIYNNIAPLLLLLLLHTVIYLHTVCLTRLYFSFRWCSILYKQCVYECECVCVRECVCIQYILTYISMRSTHIFEPSKFISWFFLFLLYFVRWLFISIHLSWCDLFVHFLSFPKSPLPKPKP